MRSEFPKAAHRLAGRPLVSYALRAVAELGARPIVVVVGFGAEQVRRVCAGFDVRFALQEEQRGTGHATLCGIQGLGEFDGDVLILYADLPRLAAATLRALVQARRAAGAALALLTAKVADPRGYGRIVRDGGRIVRIVEDRDATEAERRIDEVNVGIYCARADFLRRALACLRPENAQGELYLTDIVAIAAAEGAGIAWAAAPAAEVAQVNSRGELAEMERMLREQINRRWMEAGVTLEDPATTYIEESVEIGPDTVIGPNVHLRGATRVGARCRFDGTAYVRDTTIGDDTHVKFGAVLTDAVIGPRCEIGPFAHVRAGSQLGAGVAVGNFVETKEARVGPGSKARHLAYLGDVEIGSETNVGAGTITCNYDGFRKYRTTIGSRVMIGSDSQLVAPVVIGDDAYVASGTTVRKDVPPGALVFNAKKQVTREGWVAARRAREREAATREGEGESGDPRSAGSGRRPNAKARGTAETARASRRRR